MVNAFYSHRFQNSDEPETFAQPDESPNKTADNASNSLLFDTVDATPNDFQQMPLDLSMTPEDTPLDLSTPRTFAENEMQYWLQNSGRF